MTDVISGIKIPDSKIARKPPSSCGNIKFELLFNHSVRVFVFRAMKKVFGEI